MADEIMKIEQGIEPYEQQGTSIETSRATAESQAGFIMAKQFPRNENRSMSRIVKTCQRVSLAQAAEYSFPRGGSEVRGPSVRLAEAVAQNWGNILFGIRELEQKEGETVMMAYCYDLETNTRAERIFNVKHQRSTKQGPVDLTDPRDVYEHLFNLGARRKRAVILEVIPGDVIEMAVEACRETLKAAGQDATPENIKAMVTAFEEHGVTPEMIEMRLGKNIAAITAVELGGLRRIWHSLKDGMSTPKQWFSEDVIKQPKEKEPAKEEPKKAKPKKKAPAKKKAKEEPPADPPPPEPSPSPSEAKPSESKTGDLPLGGKMVEPGENTLQDRIEKVAFKKGGTNKDTGAEWKLYEITTASGEVFSCFDAKIVESCESCMDNEYLAELEFRSTKYGNQLIGLDILG